MPLQLFVNAASLSLLLGIIGLNCNYQNTVEKTEALVHSFVGDWTFNRQCAMKVL